MSMKSVISRTDERLTTAQTSYLQAFAQDRAHDMVRELFMNIPREEGVTRAFLARRLGKKPEQITRWLSVPGNWTLNTFADLLAAMGYVPTFGFQRLQDMQLSNEHHPAVRYGETLFASVVQDQGVTTPPLPASGVYPSQAAELKFLAA
jgi:hypothetical protein